MNFNTLTFIAFFVAVGALYAMPLRWSTKKLLLLLASYVFYGWWNVNYLSLILLSTLIDYRLAAVIHASPDPRIRRIALVGSIATNLGILAVFKYFNFFAESAVDVLHSLGMQADFFTLNVLLPVGISFYTFQSMSYSIDVYRRKLAPVDSFADFALYVSFFPQLVAGPIVRATHFLPQLLTPRRPTLADLELGLAWVVIGYFFKTGIADNLASSVDLVFASSASAHPLELWLGVNYFSIQIFADFFGYTLIARGVARMLGFDLPSNFNSPYIARSFSDFWQRWHISLSSWLRDYLYIPLGGNRHGTFKTYRNLMLTMLLGGLWHGAAWTFVVWGALHGSYLVLQRVVGGWIMGFAPAQRLFGRRNLAGDIILIMLTYHLVLLAWVFFRAEDLGQALTMVQRMLDLPQLFTFQMPNKSVLKDGIWMLPAVAYFAWNYIAERRESGFTVPPSLRMAALGGLAFVTITCREASDAFIYFQF